MAIIGIHHTKGTFSERWITFCEERGIEYKLVDCYRTDIIEQLEDCDALMWHFNHKGSRESKFAKQLLFSVMSSGKIVFPDFNTVWHFDDKVGQKYLLESIKAPLAPSYVFYSLQSARDWASLTSYPKVWKLRNGAGSDNVRLVHKRKEALKLIRKAFRTGFKQYDGWRNLLERIRKYRIGKTNLKDVLRGIIRLVYTTDYARVTGNEKGYVYFQDYIPGNDFDIRVVVIGNKAFAIKRMVRENDFRASGSGTIFYEKEHFDIQTIKLAFEVNKRLMDQCMAYDFVYKSGEPLIVEISYGFAIEGYDACVGYWDNELNWHEGSFNPYGWMIQDIIKKIEEKK